jgi:3-hydroxy-9,10-secoandrosta-1,3,5(10)-triene-9,17-dione monooxygenase
MSTSRSIPTAEALLARARDMVPAMRERAAKTEAARRLLPETHRDFIEAGFYKVLQPKRYGGYGLDYGVNCEISTEIARGCASSGWVSSITTCHAWIVGMMDKEAQEHVWGDDDGQLVASCFFAAEQTAERVKGGYKVSGRWRFSSGVDVCDWVLVMVLLPVNAGGMPDRMFTLLPLKDCEIVDVWHVTGLAGTGSNDVIAKDLFVPDSHMLRTNELNGGPTPGCEVNAEHIYALPLWGVFSYNLVGTGIGAALGAVETLADQIRARPPTRHGANLKAMQSVQLRIARASAEADAARTIVQRNFEEMNRLTREKNYPDEAQRMRYRRDASYASLLAVQAVGGLFPLIGGQGLANDNAIGRFWRDAHAVHQHIALTWDNHGSAYGEWRLGGSPAQAGEHAIR